MPVAPNAHPDGSDYPKERQKNRRVETLIHKTTAARSR
jgi:outer membrane protein OmpA-like peptidoglycan-associated protein